MSDLARRPLGHSGRDVTTLGFGAMELRGAPSGPAITEAEAERLLNAVLDAGINFIDTAVDYGRSEELIGRFIAHRRAEYLLASKCGCVPGAPPGAVHVHTRQNIRAGVIHSLRTLRTDYLDLVQFHYSITRQELEAHGALDEALALKREGKVRLIGISGVLPQLDEQIAMGVFDVFQIPYSALQREHEDVIARASAAGAGIIIRGSVARGAPEGWRERTYYMLTPEQLRARWDNAHLDDLLVGMSRMEFMLRFTLSSPHLDTAIVGTKNIDHFRANVAAALRGPLPRDTYEEARRRLVA